MPEIIEDIIQGGSTNTDGNVWKDTRVFIVTSVEGEPAARRYNAMQADGIPKRNSPHPAIPGAVVKDITCETLGGGSNTQFRVTVNYESGSGSNPNEPQQEPRVSVGSTATPVTTNMDHEEKVMKVSYQWPNNRGKLGPDEQVGRAEVQVPSTLLTYSRIEKENPIQKSLAFCGKINATGMLGDDPKTWLCTRIQGDSDDDGETFNVTYEFQRKPEGMKDWDVVVSYIDREKDEVPKGIGIEPNSGGEFNAGLAIKKFQVYKTANFGLLQLGII